MDKRNIKIKSLTVSFLLIACLTASLFTYGFSNRRLQLETYADNGIIRLITGDFNSASIKTDADVFNVLNKLKDTYGYKNAHRELVLDKTLDAAFGRVYRFNQIKDGLLVFGRGLNVSVDFKGRILSVSGNYLKGIKTHSVPKIDKETAAEIVFDTYINAQINSIELQIYSLNNSRPFLAYNVEAFTDGGRSSIFINANTGAVIEEIPLDAGHLPWWDETTVVNTTQKDYYGNDKSVDVEEYYGYYLSDAYRNIILFDYTDVDLEEYQNNPLNPENQPQLYFSPDGKFTDGLAVTALLNTINAFDFYVNADNIGVSLSGVDNTVDGTHTNKEAYVIVNLHYGDEYENANCYFDPNFIDDTFGRYMYLIFGDGGSHSRQYDFAAAADIVGHEYQHAVTRYTAGLIYQNASGALDEAYSDIFGALIQGYDQTDDNFWIVGEDTTANRQGGRSMKNPSRYGYSDHIDNMYPFADVPAEENDQGGVHYNSTIITHAQYKMYQALPSHFTKQNIGKLWYAALTMLSPDSNFVDFKIIMRQAAIQLNWDGYILDIMDDAFTSCGIVGVGGEHTITFNQGEMTGDAPSPILLNYGEKFVIPNSNLTYNRAKLTGWSETGNYQSEIYLVGQQYAMPARSFTLYPVLEREIWNGIEPVVLSGEGTKVSPYLIPTAQALATVAYYFNNDVQKPWDDAVPHFLMTADIDLQNIPWLPIGRTTGSEGETAEQRISFDGGGYVIKGLKICYEDPFRFIYQGLFGAMGGIDITRLGIESGSIETATYCAAAIIGIMRGGSITDCFNRINVSNTATISYGGTLSYSSAGGIAGFITGDGGAVTYCANYGDIDGNYAGGICAIQYDDVPLTGCVNTGAITAVMMGGGIVGISSRLNSINCINTGTIDGNNAYYTYMGGICGALNSESKEFTSQIIGCKNTAAFTEWFSGALIGMIIVDCSVLLEDNHYINQGNKLYIGNLSGLNDPFTVLGSTPVCSEDKKGEGDFAFNNIEYFLDYYGLSEESAIRMYCMLSGARSIKVMWNIDGETETEMFEYGLKPTYGGTPTKESDAQYSYTFTDWADPFTANGSIVYVAQFTETINEYLVTFISAGKVLDTQTVFYGDKLSGLPSPTRKGYTFKGWYKDESYSAAFNAADDQILGQTELYAKWTKNKGGLGCGTVNLSSGALIFLTLTLAGLALCLKPRRLKRVKV